MFKKRFCRNDQEWAWIWGFVQRASNDNSDASLNKHHSLVFATLEGNHEAMERYMETASQFHGWTVL